MKVFGAGFQCRVVAKVRSAREPPPASRPLPPPIRPSGDGFARRFVTSFLGVSRRFTAPRGVASSRISAPAQVLVDAETRAWACPGRLFAGGQNGRALRARRAGKPRQVGILADRILIIEKGDHRRVLLDRGQGGRRIGPPTLRADRLVLEASRPRRTRPAFIRRHRKMIGPEVDQAFCKRPRGEGGTLGFAASTWAR